MKRLSVVIANHNYERFLSAAIDSALGLDWPDVEVIVVDDGSTDGSRALLSSYAGRVRVILSENRGQREAANTGFEASTGDAVVFLDSDDVLPDDLPREVDRALVDGVSKVQFQMQPIDCDGTPVGPLRPTYDPLPTSADIRHWMLRTSAYPTPPGSGNVYSRWFLDRIFPLPAGIGAFADSGCLAAAPLLGDVVSIPGVLIGYRRHDANDSNLLRDASRFRREVERARARWHFAHRVTSEVARPTDDKPLRASRELLQLRIAAMRCTGSTGLPGDSRLRLAVDTIRSPFQPGPERPPHRLAIAIWSLVTLFTPVRVSTRLVRFRYGQRS